MPEPASIGQGGDEPPSPAAPSSTVVLLRDAEGGPEVLLLERDARVRFAAGAHAFPGGRVEPADRALPAGRWRGVDLAAAASELGAAGPAEALGFLVAAVRETFEEAGILLARCRGRPVTAGDLARPAIAAGRHLPAAGWAGWLAANDLVLDLGALALFSWWVTPRAFPHRYDTRFFLALLPPAQAGAAAHDRSETTSALWIAPAAALAAARAGELTLVYPTRRTLAALARHPSAAAAWHDAAAGRTDRRRIEPVAVRGPDGALLIRHPDGGPSEPH